MRREFFEYFWMDARRTIETGGSYLMVMTERRKRPTKQTPKRTKKKFIENIERDNEVKIEK